MNEHLSIVLVLVVYSVLYEHIENGRLFFNLLISFVLCILSLTLSVSPSLW